MVVEISKFKEILRKSQSELKVLVKEYIEKIGYKPIIGDGFIYAKGEIPIMLVAHMDTVHRTKPTNIYYDKDQKVMWSPQGIGGDDRCGVYIILKLLNEFKPYILFTEDEEKGGIGARKTIESIKKPNVKFIIEIDRRGKNDCVFYNCDNKDFHKYIEKFGFTSAWGTYSDIVDLSNEWDIASVNLSSGYYNEHTTSETINTDDMVNTYNRVIEILKDDKNNKKYFDYQKKTYVYNYHYNSKNNDKKDYQEKSSSKQYLPKERKTKSGVKNIVYEDEWGYEEEDGTWHWWNEEDSENYWGYRDKDGKFHYYNDDENDIIPD